jgi:outer membrane protein TolC
MAFEEALSQARTNHPKLLSLILQESAARSAVDAAIADFYPALTLQGSFAWQGSLTPLTWFSYLGPALSYVIFSGWEKTGVLHETVATLRQAYANRAQEEQQVFLDLRSGYTQLEDARESLKILDLTVKEAEEQLDLAQGRYTAGKASAVDLTDAQVALATARANEIQARWDFEIAIAGLERSIGGMTKAK